METLNASQRHGEYIQACSRLYAEVEPGAHIAYAEIVVHNGDGTEVSYITAPGAARIARIIHAGDHIGCTDATVDDEEASR